MASHNFKTLQWIQTGIAAAVVAVCASASGQVIRIAAQASVEPRQDVRLGDIATVSGVDRRSAESLANTIIVSGIDGPRTLKTESILLALMSQRGGMGGNLQIGGAAECALTVGGNAPLKRALEVELAAPPAQTAMSVVTASAVAPAASTSVTPDAGDEDSMTLSKLIFTKIQQGLEKGPDDIRVKIETMSSLLDAPVPASRKWICRPLTRTLLGTVHFEAQLVEGSRVIEKLNVQTKVELRQMVVTLVTRLERGDIVTAKMVKVNEAWLDRRMPTLFTSDKDVIGLEAQRAADMDTRLDQRDFRPALMAAKGDAVNVIYQSGTLKVQIRGRAMSDGKLNDQVEVRNEMTGERYMAQMIGKRLGVVGEIPEPTAAQKNQETR